MHIPNNDSGLTIKGLNVNFLELGWVKFSINTCRNQKNENNFSMTMRLAHIKIK